VANGGSQSDHAGWIAAGIIVAVIAAYLSTLGAGFIWDDDRHVTAPALRSIGGLWRIWFERGATQQYYPLLHTVFWLEHHLWGSAALGYHLANVVFHAGVAVLFWRVLRRLNLPGAFLAALLFALHPVHVESVAWISEQKNTLSTLFYLAALLCYLRFDVDRRWQDYAWATAWFACALLTKSVTATLPAAILVVLWWRRGQLDWRRDVWPVLPWFILGVIAGLHTAWVERTLIGAEGAAFEFTFVQRLLLAARVPFFYLGKLLWPARLTFIYPRWTIHPADLLAWLPLCAAALITAAAWRLGRRMRAPLAAWLLFVGSLFPVLGFFNVFPFQYSFVADHFQYLASLPIIALLAATLCSLVNRPLQLTWTVASGALVACAALTWRQTQLYHSSETLYRATIARNPTCWMAYNNLGREVAADPQRRDEAIALFERAIELHPTHAEALSNLGLALAQAGRVSEALTRLETSLRLNPHLYQAYNNYAIALVAADRLPDAVNAFARAAELNPQLPQIQENWARILQRLGREAEAAEHFAAAKRLRAAEAR
jgi:tetratricopeptide (TPR) repeat protein